MGIPRPLSVALPFLGLLACGIDETYTGLGKGALPGDPLNPKGQKVECTGTSDCTCNCNCAGGPAADAIEDVPLVEVADLSDRAYRFDSLVLNGPFTGEVLKLLNDYFASEVEKKGLNVLLDVLLDDRDTGELTLRIGAGEASGDSFAFQDDGSEVGCILEGDRFTTAKSAFLVFPNAALKPPELPIRELELSGRVAVDGSAIAEGKLVGALTVKEAAGITVLGLPLDKFLEQSDIPPDLDLDGDKTADAWEFEFEWTAQAATIQEN
ncbi:MAG: hypothetical protein FJ109_02500 [Deltaproteobacteria bacterium]|nr:hypothetical protein [Deltaproteobacteria bacterium]